MQNAETVLDVLRERGKKGQVCNELYRQLYNPDLYLRAYGNIYSNKGAMTPGATSETVDGMSLERIGRIIEAIRRESYRFSPVRRVYIPKKDGRKRPLGLPTWSDKLVGEVIRLLLQAIYEPTFSDHSHGFRPGRGCHTALREVADTWTGTTWFIECDITDCFNQLDHSIMLEVLAERIHDNRFLRLIGNMLAAGYLEDWVWNATYSGAPQGGVLSPVLSNIYLHKLDEFVEKTLIPQYTRGRTRKDNPLYRQVQRRYARTEDPAMAKELRARLRTLPTRDTNDPGYRRLRYMRYADDQLFGFTGPKAEAQEVKDRLAAFLRDHLKLELNPGKTLITHARTRPATFLGYHITVAHDDTMIGGKGKRGRMRTINGKIQLRVPPAVIRNKASAYQKRGKPAHRTGLTSRSDHDIVATYGSEFRGFVQYYLLAVDVYKLNRLQWVMGTSMLRTLARKHDSTVAAMARKCRTVVTTPHGPRTCMEARVERNGRKPLVARFGGIPLHRDRRAVLDDRPPNTRPHRPRQLVTRLVEGRCEVCDSTEKVAAHHIRKLADLDRLGQPLPLWAALMATRRRTSLIVCQACHDTIHTPQPTTLATLT